MMPVTTSSFDAGSAGIQTQRGFAAGRCILEFRFGEAKSSVRAGIAEVPGELHACDLNASGAVNCRAKTFDAQIGLPIRFSPTKNMAVSVVQMISSLVLPWEYAALAAVA